jgi:hypothetical protein
MSHECYLIYFNYLRDTFTLFCSSLVPPSSSSSPSLARSSASEDEVSEEESLESERLLSLPASASLAGASLCLAAGGSADDVASGEVPNAAAASAGATVGWFGAGACICGSQPPSRLMIFSLLLLSFASKSCKN